MGAEKSNRPLQRETVERRTPRQLSQVRFLGKKVSLSGSSRVVGSSRKKVAVEVAESFFRWANETGKMTMHWRPSSEGEGVQLAASRAKKARRWIACRLCLVRPFSELSQVRAICRAYHP